MGEAVGPCASTDDLNGAGIVVDPEGVTEAAAEVTEIDDVAAASRRSWSNAAPAVPVQALYSGGNGVSSLVSCVTCVSAAQAHLKVRASRSRAFQRLFPFPTCPSSGSR